MKILRPRPPDPATIPPYGVLVGRMIFIGGFVLALLGLSFLVMLGIAAGSLVALLLFGLVTIAGVALALLAVRDLTGKPVPVEAVLVSRSKLSEGGNPVYNLKFRLAGSDLKDKKDELDYNVTSQDWENFQTGDRVVIYRSAFFKLLVQIRLLERRRA